MSGQSLGEKKRARPPDIMLKIIVELGLKAGVLEGLGVGRLDRENQRHQGLGDKAPAINAKMPAFIRTGAEGIRNLHRFSSRAATIRARGPRPERRGFCPYPFL